MEVWKDIAGFEGKYQVSNLGRVRSLQRVSGSGKGYLRKEKILKPQPTGNGYWRVCLYDGTRYKRYRLNRLVLETFNPVDGMDRLQVNHNDECKANNRLDNLCWMTARDNNNYGTHNERLSKSKCKPIYCVELDRVFEGAIVAEQVTGVARQNIHKVAKGLRPKAGGYHWQYVK